MEIKKYAVAGTAESCDVQVSVEPSSAGLSVQVKSRVMNRYGRQIKITVLETLNRLGVTSGCITVNDQGALDFTIKARVECVVFRSIDASEKDIPWGGIVQ